MTTTTDNLPLVTVQHDFQTVIDDVRSNVVSADKFWVSCYKTGETSVHGSVLVRKSGSDVELDSQIGIEFAKLENVCP